MSASDARQFKRYKVVAKTAESACITSFVLQPEDGSALPTWQPGQYLIFKFDLEGQSYLRHYSIAAAPGNPAGLRIAVKREAAPAEFPDAPAGVISQHMHDTVHVGDTLVAAGPLGDFVLNQNSERPVLLISGGVGVTPVLAMLQQLVQHSDRRVDFIHGCQDGNLHAFASEVQALVAQRANVHSHLCYLTPTDTDRQHAAFKVEGLLTREHLQSWLPLDDYECYVCGPTPFMQAVWQMLRSLGIAQDRIHYEFFGTATVLEKEPVGSEVAVADEASVSVTPTTAQAVDASGETVEFVGKTSALAWDPAQPSLLDFAEAQGLEPYFNCRSGLCNSCMCTLVSGEVEYVEEPLDMPPEGKVLLCCSKPRGAVVIELAE
ncbi:2Fe-2S iron-sulfur cluster-binding protein [Paenalcaligenes suwonensis]|uniref:2Fe-2S iron-sulfur cluster-binding protein n=1 Tax=Paenalcaligenes suwonensis TaxID=1202713 RepID=UPI00140BDDC8|nr:2Fe-2S iron-sulfur cluster-binding protein [Paenalcaligenes suwonensis]NHC61587.1 2Fe-2S iron-sulfur cluster binding domain-containing protein [Paenalcaligenes suwonensis]